MNENAYGGSLGGAGIGPQIVVSVNIRRRTGGSGIMVGRWRHRR